jgi:hypothetical protein
MDPFKVPALARIDVHTLSGFAAASTDLLAELLGLPKEKVAELQKSARKLYESELIAATGGEGGEEIPAVEDETAPDAETPAE